MHKYEISYADYQKSKRAVFIFETVCGVVALSFALVVLTALIVIL